MELPLCYFNKVCGPVDCFVASGHVPITPVVVTPGAVGAVDDVVLGQPPPPPLLAPLAAEVAAEPPLRGLDAADAFLSLHSRVQVDQLLLLLLLLVVMVVMAMVVAGVVGGNDADCSRRGRRRRIIRGLFMLVTGQFCQKAPLRNCPFHNGVLQH